MKVIGIRNYSNGIRYCIFECIDGETTFENKDTEHKILKPKGFEGKELYIWYKKEIDRLLDQNNQIKIVAIKQNENSVQTCYGKLKDVMFFDCIASMAAYERNVEVYSLVYNQIGVNSKNVKQMAEYIIGGKTSKYWDEKIADAIVAAYKILQR